MVNKEELQAGYDAVTANLRDAQLGIQKLFGAEPSSPVTRAAYEAATHLDTCFLWFGQAVSLSMQRTPEAIQDAVDAKLKSGDLKIVNGGKKPE